eukprot:CAMPEP_0204028746 /NCGR_PEP_ID=MMETSP0360-20130528/52947_1 /ASSEMBLY_ACC=CAM_ASM_000342 /TAXON_ID=268821 /ORGANISM="Scrippsiella Hangoei, Strain SHTV-5" /LENGTH=62 /DNA_ID=CAMNT_0050972617 /DNA_START=35 /DNA_END=220 /DNA_ORIENTATION=-
MATQSKMRPYCEKWSRSIFVVVFRVSPPMNNFAGQAEERKACADDMTGKFKCRKTACKLVLS